MPWGRFLLANAAGAVVWAVAISLLGYYFGENWHLLEKWLGRGGLIALLCVLLIGVPLAWRRLRLPPPKGATQARFRPQAPAPP
jgi:membrane protein DedA with SNARE-associated domain